MNHRPNIVFIVAADLGCYGGTNVTMPSIPDDATVSLGYGARDMPQR